MSAWIAFVSGALFVVALLMMLVSAGADWWRVFIASGYAVAFLGTILGTIAALHLAGDLR